jgi:hypothetical protein
MGAIVQTAIVIALWLLALRVWLWITGAFTLGTIPKATRRLATGFRGFGVVDAGRKAIAVRVVVGEVGLEIAPGISPPVFMPFEGMALRVVRPFRALRFTNVHFRDVEIHASTTTKRAILRAFAKFRTRDRLPLSQGGPFR